MSLKKETSSFVDERNSVVHDGSFLQFDKNFRSSRKFTEKGKGYQIETLTKSLKRLIKSFDGRLSEIRSTVGSGAIDPNICEKLGQEIEETFKSIIRARDNLLTFSGAQLDQKITDKIKEVRFNSEQIQGELAKAKSFVFQVLAHARSEIPQAQSVSRKTHRSKLSQGLKSYKSSVSSQRYSAEVEAATAAVELQYLDKETEVDVKLAKQNAEKKRLELLKRRDVANVTAKVLRTEASSVGTRSIPGIKQLSSEEKVNAFVEHIEAPLSFTTRDSVYHKVLQSSTQSVSQPVPGCVGSQNKSGASVGLSTHVINTEETATHSQSCTRPATSTVPPKVSFSEKINPIPQIQSTPTNTFTEQPSIVDITKSMADQLTLSRLPVVEPAVFDGSDPLSFPCWKISFDTLIHNKGIPSNERLHYLNRYLSGAAKEAVQGFFMLSSDEAYVRSYDLLVKRYGDQFILASAFRDKLKSWPKINSNDCVGLRKFVDFLRQCETAMLSLKGLEILNDESENSSILQKLPSWLVRRWARKVADYRLATTTFPTFAEFVIFLSREEDIANDPVLVNATSKVGDGVSPKPVVRDKVVDRSSKSTVTKSIGRNFAADVKEVCSFCDGSHHVRFCETLVQSELTVRADFIKKKGLCLSCLRGNHLIKECKSKSTCEQCGGKHHTAAHDVRITASKLTDQVNSTSACGSTMARGSKSSMIVPVYLSCDDNPRKELLVYCMLDTQSDQSFLLHETCNQLNVEGKEVDLVLSTLTDRNKHVPSLKVSGLSVRGVGSSTKIQLPSLYSRTEIPVDRNHIPVPEMIDKWSNLEQIKQHIYPLFDVPVALLLGYNCSRALVPLDVIPPIEDGPFAIKTELGWSIVGLLDIDESGDWGTSHRITCDVQQPSDRLSVQFSFRSKVKEVIDPSKVLRALESDFQDGFSQESKGLSIEDRKFLDLMEKEIQVDSEGFYEMPLPFKSDRIALFDNRELVTKRTLLLKSKLEKDSTYFDEYFSFMDGMFKNKYAEEVPPSEVDSSRNVWYIPHFGVYHKVKKKLRIVFDCSARYNRVSLNDTLMSGPDLVNSLFGVLLRFRKEPIAFIGDIEKMFYRFRVKPDYRDFLRFLWWKDGDLSKPLTVYRMNVHIFGAVSSPSCATFGLRKIANDHETSFGVDAGNFIRQDFYVDDGLKSVCNEASAMDLIHRSVQLCKQGNVRLHKFVSNSKEVIESVPLNDRADSLQDIDLNFDTTIPKVLGVQWSILSDQFRFQIDLPDRPSTRRGILSIVSSLYDPLGFVAPFTVRGKQLLQSLCSLNLDWDDAIPSELDLRWKSWCSEVVLLSDFKVKRSYNTPRSDVVQIEMHHFSDASTTGYGQCSYLRQVDKHGNIYLSFLAGKARVAPLRKISIPRLELAAAVLSVRMAQRLQHELKLDTVHYYWTDSKVVLGYITNEVRRFHVYVANRVQYIRDHTNKEQWYFVRGDCNPADEGSRGLKASDLVKGSAWLTGPEFLKYSCIFKRSQEFTLPENDPEVKRVRCLASISCSSLTTLECSRYLRASNWSRLIKAIALCLGLKSRLKQRITCGRVTRSKSWSKSILDSISVVDLLDAEREILKSVQVENFSNERDCLLKLNCYGDQSDRAEARIRNRAMKTISSLHKLDCFLDSNGLIRVGGRIQNANLSLEETHPIVLPKTHHVTTLIIRHYHERVYHQGRLLTHNAVRAAGFWIINGSSRVSEFINKCVTCRKLRGNMSVQKMASLPEDRVRDSAPFDYTGVDYFGPFLIKEGRKELKRYGVIFTCMASRAVHLEVANSLTTDSFINALRRFVSVRGPIRLLRSDQGTNFIGARGQMSGDTSELDVGKVKDYLLKTGCDFEFQMNPPHSSHMGGSWERLIRSVRNILSVLLAQLGSQLDDECLRTLMAEVMAILNARPLAAINLNDESAPIPLSPSQLITMKSNVVLSPPGEFERADMYSIKRWLRVQFLTNEFWKRWRTEYLFSLQARRKWQTPRRNLSVGDVVIIGEESVPRNCWKLGKIVEVFPSQDGLVRKVKLLIGNRDGSKDRKYLERSVQKLVCILEASD